MIRSMTGFASLTLEDPSATVTATVRAVNHRFLDLQVRLPQALAPVEARLRALVQQGVSRGRVELSVTAQPRQPVAPEVELNEPFIERLGAAMDGARMRGLVSGGITPGDLLRLPHALVIREAPPEQGIASPATTALVETAVAQAIADLETMRVTEGEHLAADLAERCRTLGQLVERLEAAAADGRERLQARLHERVAELSRLLEPDPVAIAQEMVRTAQRSDITEEVVRMRAHLAQWATLSASPEPVGRKLDFLVQEMNREINTIGSKTDGVAAPALVVEAKAELERIREQVQNVE